MSLGWGWGPARLQLERGRGCLCLLLRASACASGHQGLLSGDICTKTLLSVTLGLGEAKKKKRLGEELWVLEAPAGEPGVSGAARSSPWVASSPPSVLKKCSGLDAARSGDPVGSPSCSLPWFLYPLALWFCCLGKKRKPWVRHGCSWGCLVPASVPWPSPGRDRGREWVRNSCWPTKKYSYSVSEQFLCTSRAGGVCRAHLGTWRGAG